MKSALPALALTATALLSTGCVSVQPTLLPPSACSELVGPSLRADVPPVPLPDLNGDIGDVWVAFDGQTGRLETANTNRKALVEVIERCEARDAKAAERIVAPWWKRLFD